MKKANLMTKSYRALLIGVALATTAGCGSRQNHEVPIGKAGDEPLSISGVSPIRGTSLMQATVSPRERGLNLSSGPSGYSEDNIRNIIIIDPASGVSRRLLSNNSRTILNVYWLPDVAGVSDLRWRDVETEDAIAFYVFPVFRGDTTGLLDVYAGSIEDESAKLLLSAVQEIYSATSLGNRKIALILAKDGRVTNVTVDMANRTILSQTPVAIQ